jgi:hypothetical protein
MKTIFSSIIMISLVFNGVALVAQVKKVPKITAPVSKFDPDTKVEGKPDDSANDFSESGLPAPEDFGGVANDQLAAALARELVKYDEDKLPLLITTLQRAGFFIINDKQKTLYQPTNGQGMGLAFYDYEVAGMYKLSRRGIISSYSKIAARMGRETPDFPPARVSELLMRDLKTAANSPKKEVRFWARLIVELGRNASAPVDLLTSNSPDAPLSVIQASLIERRLIGDIIAFAENSSARLRPFQPRRQSVWFETVAYAPQGPCQPNNVESLVLDGASIGITTAHGQFLEAVQGTLSDKGQATLGKLSNGLFIVNLILGWAKLVAALTAIKGEMKIEDPMPLERTKNANEGQTRLMTAKLWSEVGNKSWLNCTRLALNTATGLDFSMPNDGPLAQRDVSWEMTGASSQSGQKTSKTGRFDNFVNLKPPEGANRDPSQQISDDNGESKMNLVGAPKIPTVINKAVVPVRKKAGIKVAVALKAKGDIAQNFIDLGGAVVGTLISGPLAVLGSLPEIAFRMKFDVGKLTVPVKDWELCTDDWAGSVTYRRVFKTAYSINQGSRKGTRTIDEKTEITWTLNPRTRDMPVTTPPIPADVDVDVDNSDVFEGIGEADVCCTKEASKDSGARIREAFTMKVSNQGRSLLKVELSNNFLLSIYPFIGDSTLLKGKRRRSFTVSESACPVDADQTAESTEDAFAVGPTESLQGTKTNRKLSTTGEGIEELTGTESFDDPRGGTIIYEWSLARCK